MFSIFLCYCEILLVFAKYKGFCKVTPGDIKFYIFKVRYVNTFIYTENIMKFFHSVFPLNRLLKLFEKSQFGGNYPLIFSPSYHSYLL